jgi:hypothetical protein
MPKGAPQVDAQLMDAPKSGTIWLWLQQSQL